MPMLFDSEENNINGFSFPGYFEIDPYTWLPRAQDCYSNLELIKMGRAAARLARNQYSHVRWDSPYTDSSGLACSMQANLIGNENGILTRKSVENFYKSYMRLKPSEIKSICVFRKKRLMLPDDLHSDNTVWIEITTGALRKCDIIAGNRMQTESGSIVDNARLPLISDSYNLYSRTICLSGNDAIVGMDIEPAYEWLMNKGYGSYMYVYRPTKIGPYGISKRIPMSITFSNPLPLP